MPDSFRTISFRDPFSAENKINDPNLVSLLPSILAGQSVKDYKETRDINGSGTIEFKRHWKAALIVSAVIMNCLLTVSYPVNYIQRDFWMTKPWKDCNKLEDFKSHLFFVVALLELSFLMPHLYYASKLRILVSGPCGLNQEDDDAWKATSKGCKAVEALSTMSALKLLPSDQARTERIWQTLKDATNIPNKCGKVGIPILNALFFFMGAIALYSKIESLEPDVFDKPLNEWAVFVSVFAIRPWRWPLWKFITFVNQIKGIVNIEEVKKRAVEHFMFAGEDADLQPEEEERMLKFEGQLCKHICDRGCYTYSLGGCDETHCLRTFQLAWCRFTAYVTLSAADLQRLVIKDRPISRWGRLVRAVLRRSEHSLSQYQAGLQDLIPNRHRSHKD